MRMLAAARWVWLIVAILFFVVASCREEPATPQVEYSIPELEYRLISNFGDVFWCDPDLYPIPRPDEEKTKAVDQFPAIQANEAEFAAILNHLSLEDKALYSDQEKLAVYREHKKLTIAIEITESGTAYEFTLRVGADQGERISGTITLSGEIGVLQREPSINTCPICLSIGTLIDTPDGAIPVQQLRTGMAIWTADISGQRVPAFVVETSITQVPESFQVARLALSDGRTLMASPGHPTAEGRPLGDYRKGDVLDGAFVVQVDYLPYASGATYDILPSGDTGLYWAGGVLLKSSLAR